MQNNYFQNNDEKNENKLANPSSVLKEKFLKAKPAPKSKIKIDEKKAKKITIITSIVLGVITLIILVVAILAYFNVISFVNRPSATLSSQSLQQSSQIASSEATQSNNNSVEFNFPSFFNSNSSSISSQQLSKPSSGNSQRGQNNFKITLIPDNDNLFETTTSDFRNCENNYVIGGMVKKTQKSNPKNKHSIVNRNLSITENEKKAFEIGFNFLSGKSTFMADASSDMGQDFIQYFKEDCPSVNYSKVQQINSSALQKLKNVDFSYGQIEVFGQNAFLNFGYSIYAIKGENMIRIYREYSYDQDFNQDQKEGCLKAGKPDRTCLINIINTQKIQIINQDIDKHLENIYFS